MVAAFELEEIVREARARTRVPGVAVGLLAAGERLLVADGVLELGRDEPVRPDTPFRVASISKPFTAALALASLPPGGETWARLGHTAGLRPESGEPLPEAARGLFSYANTGYWLVGADCARACGTSFEEAMRARVLAPLRLGSTGYDEPARPARGHVQEGETGHRVMPVDAYPPSRRPSGGLWSTVDDLLSFAAHLLGGPGPLAAEQRAAMQEPRSRALGAGYGLGLWVRSLPDGRPALDHEGSVAGYQSLLLLLPEEETALAVLTNSWRGSGLVRHVVERLALIAAEPEAADSGVRPRDVAGRYVLDGAEAVIEAHGDGLLVREAEVDPVTGVRISAPRFPAAPLGDGVFGFAGGLLLSHRLDFPRPGLARVGWTVRPRLDA